jgi:hypothetical protein
MAFDLEDYINAAAEIAPDMNEADEGGKNYEPPAEGYCRLRLIGYFEIGVHENKVMGKLKKQDSVILEFELFGPKHPPKEDGTQHTMQIRIPKSLNEKAHYFKLFKKLNYDGSAKHFAQLLGKPFLGQIVHSVSGEGSNQRTYANLRDASGYTVRPPFKIDDETGESLPVKVEDAKRPLRCFIWDAPKGLKDMWGSIFIDGSYDTKSGDQVEQRSKNYIQAAIKKAINFPGSPIAILLGANGEEPEVHEAETPKRDKTAKVATGASADPLSDIDDEISF